MRCSCAIAAQAEIRAADQLPAMQAKQWCYVDAAHQTQGPSSLKELYPVLR